MATNLDDRFNAPAPIRPVVASREDILGALKFGKEIEVATKHGPRLKACARPNKEFEALWQRDEQELRALGYTLGRHPKPDSPLRVTRWKKVAQQVIIQRQQARELSRATDAQITIPCPDDMAFFGYQKAGVAFAYDKPGTLLADEPGLGKTCQAIGVVNCLPETKRILVICPASLKENWRREIERWQVAKMPVFIADAKMLPDMLGWVIVNYDVLHKHEDILHRLEFDVLIADEIHYCKNKDSRRAKMVFGIKPTKKQREAGVPDVPGIKAKKKLLLTGTPICNRPAELFPLINYLDPAAWPDFFKYALRYCGAERDDRGHWNFTGASNLFELQEKLRSSIMVRRLKKDVLTDLPPKLRRVIEFDASGEMLEAMREERRQFNTEEDYNRAIDQLANGAVKGDRSTYRKNCAIAKVKMPEVMAYLDAAVAESGKIVLFIWHHEVARILKAHFGDRLAMIMGDTPVADRQDAVDRFQKGDLPVICGGIKPMGVGFTLTASSRVIFIELDDVPGNVTQAEDRLHRIGQQDNVLVEHLIVRMTLDGKMAQNCVAKQAIIEKALDAEKKNHAPAPSI